MTKHTKVMIYNAIVVVSFCVLAVVFGKWWISLFGCLFLFSHKEKTETRLNDDERSETE